MLYDPNWNRSQGEKNRIALIDLLRDRSKWPVGFVWNYALNCNCAIGLLASTTFPQLNADLVQDHTDEKTLLMKHFDLEDRMFDHIFFKGGTHGSRPVYELEKLNIQPERIAKLLEATLSPVEA